MLLKKWENGKNNVILFWGCVKYPNRECGFFQRESEPQKEPYKKETNTSEK